LLSSCSQRSKRDKTLSDFIPENSAIILKTTNLESLESDVKNNGFLNTLSSEDLFSSFKKELKKLDGINTKNEAIICISNDNNFSFISTLSDEIVENDSLFPSAETFHKITVDSFIVASTSKAIINDISSKKKETNPFLNKLLKSYNQDSSVSILINTEIATNLLDSIYTPGSIEFKNIANWISLDASLEQDKILFNGVAAVTDTLPKLINIFKNTVPQQNKTAEITPIDFDGFLSLTFDDFKTLNKNLREYRSNSAGDSTQLDLFKNTTEIGIISKEDNIAIALFSNDIIDTKDALLAEQRVMNNFREIDIYDFSKKALFKSVLNPFVNVEIDKYLILNEIVIFSNSEDILTKIVSGHQNKTTLNDSDIYKDNMSHLSDESSLLYAGNNQFLKSVLVENISEKYKKGIKNLNLKNYEFSVIQIVNDNFFAHINGIIKKNQSKATKGSITQKFNVVLDEDILNAPQLVKNHRNNQKEVIVQDVKNNLYLISNRGKVLWKKKLNGPVLGKIEQLDIYKNGRLQMAFATPKRIYLLDRNGNDVNPFPIKFNDEITQPLSVFDYDNKKKYRLFVVQGKETIMMDTRGKTVRGFKFNKASSNIITQPKHFRIGTKDYIVFASGKKLNILDRLGKNRIYVNKEFDFSDNEIYVYQNYISFTNTKGQLIQVDQKGRVNYKNLLLSANHHFTTTSKTLVSLADNKLKIKANEEYLDFGNYTAPKIFYLNDKIYVGLTDLQSHKTYLFDSQAKLIPNFPVYGNSTPELDNLDKDRNLEIVVKGDNKSVVMYQLN
jgi:hypothetical protein